MLLPILCRCLQIFTVYLYCLTLLFIFTFKLNSAVGGGVYSEILWITRPIRLLYYCSVFEHKISAIEAEVEIACKLQLRPSGYSVARYWTVHKYRKCLKELEEVFSFLVIWVLRHNEIPDTFRTETRGHTVIDKWLASDMGRMAYKILRKFDLQRTANLLKLYRYKISNSIRALTGHWIITANVCDPWLMIYSEEEEETVLHPLDICPTPRCLLF